MKFWKKLILAIVSGAVMAILPGGVCFAIDNPDSTPTIIDIYAWRNVLATGDQLYIAVENTPYATTPTDYMYQDAFTWRFFNGALELAQTTGYAFDESGYGYNVIGFYFDASDAPVWSGNYTVRLSGNPSVFADPPAYNFDIPAGAYSSLTDTDDVKEDIAATIINIADDFYTYWNLNSETTLVDENETATVLSLQGQTFFRGAIYGIQGMAPDAFPLTIIVYDTEDRTWATTYLTNLETQHAGTSIEEGFDAGEDILDVNYNLMGLLIAMVIAGVIMIGNWMMAGGNLWKGMVESVPVLVIGTRMGMVGMGEMALIAAMCAIYVSGRIWKIF